MVILLTGVTELLTKLLLFSTVPLYSKTLLQLYNLYNSVLFQKLEKVSKSATFLYF